MRKFYRSRDDFVIAGVCGGIAEIYSLDANLVRLGLVFVGLMTYIYPAVLTYAVAWMLLPERDAE